MKKLLFTAALTLAGCTSPNESGVKVIVGARLIAAPGRQPIDYSIVVIENGKISVVGPQSEIPVPKGSAITKGLGMTLEPAGVDPIEAGRPANLVLKGATERKMHNGEWDRE